MGAARFLSRTRFHYASIASTACALTCNAYRTKKYIAFEGPGSPYAPQDVGLVSHGQRLQSQSSRAKPTKSQIKKGDAELVDETNDQETYSPGFESDDEGAWANFSRNFDNVREGISRIEWAGLGDKITDFVVPSWARLIPDGIQKLQFELSMEPGTLADDIWREAHDPSINPEILWNAKVRVGDTLCEEELSFRRSRKVHVVKALAKYLDIDEKDIEPEDVPTIAICGSGGGLRAMVAGASSYLSAQEAGLFDCVTYTAGVSGSCWLQTLYYSSLGKQNHQTLLNHLKARIGTHIAFPPPALKLVTSAPTNKFILSGFVEKLKGDPTATFGLVDVYSLLLAARLMVPKGDLDVQDADLKLSNQRAYLEKGEHPMPIYTVVRHEIPIEPEEAEDTATDAFVKENLKEKAKQEAWFQWIEMHPWEVFCEEFGAGIPTWSLGRPFKNGNNLLVDTGIALPEIRQSLLLGIYGSAFCATLAHYYKEFRPIVSGITGFGGLDGLLEEKNDDLIKIHPIEPATIPNFVYGMDHQLPSTCPASVLQSDHLQLMDAGMSNNLPIYPLLRPGRDVEILIAFDASADIQKENWLSVVDGYAKQRGIRGWPVGSGWPKGSVKLEEDVEVLTEAHADSSQEAAMKLAQAREKQQPQKGDDQISDQTDVEKKPEAISDSIGYCTIWVGTKEERSFSDEPPPSKRLAWDNSEDSSMELMKPDAGVAVIYFPLLPNSKAKGVDPAKSDYLSTWNFIYTPEQVESVVSLAKANFSEGEDATKRTVRAVYERKRTLRLEKQEKSRIRLWGRKLRENGDAFAGS